MTFAGRAEITANIKLLPCSCGEQPQIKDTLGSPYVDCEYGMRTHTIDGYRAMSFDARAEIAANVWNNHVRPENRR